MRIHHVALILATVILSGCLPLPHTSERFPATQGHVVDATTGQPVSGAIVAIHDHPSTTAKTDKTGFFHLSKHRNFHLGVTVGMCGSDWPEGTEWSDLLDVSAPGHLPLQTDASNIELVPEPR